MTTTSDSAASIPLELFDDVVTWQQRRSDRDAWHVQPGSALSGDDRWTDPYRLSQAAVHRLHSAIDLHAIKLLLVDASALPTFALFTRNRAAMENAASVAWLLEPASRYDRVARRLQMAADNARSGDSAIALIQQNVEPAQQVPVTHCKMSSARYRSRRSGTRSRRP
ncbi:hypothetical protein ACIA5D_00020 [Actinoplanes sp. NPDC051513]|uniref:hypothetical protein n=1 Tax=Actinoplanes sp. NPDC051513 TaxID=3363908 RepID=UPI0037992B02